MSRQRKVTRCIGIDEVKALVFNEDTEQIETLHLDIVSAELKTKDPDKVVQDEINLTYNNRRKLLKFEVISHRERMYEMTERNFMYYADNSYDVEQPAV